MHEANPFPNSHSDVVSVYTSIKIKKTFEVPHEITVENHNWYSDLSFLLNVLNGYSITGEYVQYLLERDPDGIKNNRFFSLSTKKQTLLASSII